MADLYARQPDWKISIGPGRSSLLAEVLTCHEVWRHLTKPQRSVMAAADESGRVAGHPLALARLTARGLVDENGLLTDAGRLVLGWNDDESGPHRARLKELREELAR